MITIKYIIYLLEWKRKGRKLEINKEKKIDQVEVQKQMKDKIQQNFIKEVVLQDINIKSNSSTVNIAEINRMS